MIYATTRVNSFTIFLLSLFYCRQNRCQVNRQFFRRTSWWSRYVPFFVWCLMEFGMRYLILFKLEPGENTSVYVLELICLYLIIQARARWEHICICAVNMFVSASTFFYRLDIGTIFYGVFCNSCYYTALE